MTSYHELTRDEALQKMQRLCSMREKCRHDISEKLRSFGVTGEDAGWVIGKLEEDKFIDDARYAAFFTRDKFRFNRWGRLKIRNALQHKMIDKEIIEDALLSIDEDEYLEVMQGEAMKKSRTIKDGDDYRKKSKIMQFLAGRGVEPNLVYDIVDKVIDTQ